MFALSRCTFPMLCRSGSSPEESVHDGALVEIVDKVDPDLKREKSRDDTVSARGLLELTRSSMLANVTWCQFRVSIRGNKVDNASRL